MKFHVLRYDAINNTKNLQAENSLEAAKLAFPDLDVTRVLRTTHSGIDLIVGNIWNDGRAEERAVAIVNYEEAFRR